MKLGRVLATSCATIALASSAAMATPSTQIWIPSPDVRGFKEVHLDVDYYGRFSGKPAAVAGANMYDIGLSAGISPFENVKLEIGADMIKTTGGGADNHPFYFHAKMGIPEDAFGIKGMPAIAGGIYGLGTYKGEDANTAQNIAYGLVGKTFPVVGRLSVGGYHGSKSALNFGYTDKHVTENGVMASWDRTMSEISDKLWFAVDYMSGNNYNGALSFGGSWAFTKNISLLVGAVFFNPFQDEPHAGGKPAFTTQLDISF